MSAVLTGCMDETCNYVDNRDMKPDLGLISREDGVVSIASTFNLFKILFFSS